MKHQHIIYKCLCFILFLFIFYVYFSSEFSFHSSSSKTGFTIQADHHGEVPHRRHTCYDAKNYGDGIDLLEDVLVSKVQPRPGKSILFHETSCRNGTISINARQACAIESAARTNPNANVFVMFASPVGFVKNETKNGILDSIMSYDNVHLRNLNLWTYARDTPLNDFLHTNQLFQSNYVTSHMSDFLRYLRWGGTYLDLDVIVKQNLDFYENYAGAESTESVNVAMVHFDNGTIGNKIASKCLQDFDQNFDGKEWGTNDHSSTKSICETDDITMMTRERCHGFVVQKPSSVYAIYYDSWKYFFDENYTNYVLNATSDSIAVHVWNKFSYSKSIRVGSNTAYGLLARDYCPRVYGSCGDYF